MKIVINREHFINSYTMFREIQDETIFLHSPKMIIAVCIIQLGCK
jgi:hypothetical protein